MGTRAPDTCARHRKPALSTCVACGATLCAQCIVRTPVGFKCASCTGDRVDPPPRGCRHRSAPPDDLDAEDTGSGAWRRWALPAGVTITLLGLVTLAAYALTRSSTTATVTTGQIAPQIGPTDIQVQFAGAGGLQLSGILSLPAKSSQPAAAVLVVPDSGSVDRDGIAPAGSLPDPLYADVARTLTSRGIASLRYDPRGQGQSPLPPGTALQLPDLVGDSRAGLRLLAGRTEIDPKRLTILGDGWGGLVALQLAAQDHSAAALVLVSTPGRPVVDTVAGQLQASAVTPADGQTQVQQLRATVADLLAGAHLPGPAELDTALRPILQPGQEAYLRAVFGLSPADLAKQIRLPTLIVRGGLDPSIAAADSDALDTAIGARAQVLVAKAAGHTLSIVTPASTGPTTVPTPAGGMQNIHLGSSALIVRDDTTLIAIVGWISPQAVSPAAPGPPLTPPVPDGHIGH